ncbi:MAG TPA: 3-oxoadipate enol-lactonase [Gaiellaceae bacterium]|nr:3-oxoadipate enol-lactonase [Gaiellaceae bacterium]
MRLGCRLDGPEGAPALALFGSLGSTTNVWEPQLAAFASCLRVVRFDYPGHGGAPVPDRPVTVDGIAASALAVLDELGIGRLAVCGLSLGGMVAMLLGASAPERVDRLVLACTGAKIGTPEMWSERADLVRRNGTAAVAAGIRERWFTPAFRDSPAAEGVIGELLTIPAEGYARGCEAVGAFDFRSELGRIGQPVLVLAGAEDPVTPPDVLDPLVGGIANAALVTLPDAAHLANVEQPDAFAAAVLSHLEERAVA